jgi:hypothetical protein
METNVILNIIEKEKTSKIEAARKDFEAFKISTEEKTDRTISLMIAFSLGKKAISEELIADFQMGFITSNEFINRFIDENAHLLKDKTIPEILNEKACNSIFGGDRGFHILDDYEITSLVDNLIN